MTTKPETGQVHHLHEAEIAFDRFVFHPENNDVFMRTGRQVIAACELGISVEVWKDEADSMFEAVRKWCRLHAEQIKACHMVSQPSGMKLFIVPTSETFDFDLADELPEFNRHLGQTYKVGPVEIFMVPESELTRFVHIETEQQASDDATDTPETVES